MLAAQSPEPGRVVFEKTCAKCHGGDGNGGEMGPNILFRLSTRNDSDLAGFIRKGSPNGAMPGVNVSDAEMPALIRFLRSIERRPGARPQVRLAAKLNTGTTLEGVIANEGFDDVQLRTD